jgi:hypothetical protein
MNTQTRWAMVPRLLMAATILTASVACGSEMLRTGRAPVYLVVSSIQVGTGTTSILRSDVQSAASIFDDLATATIRVEPKNTTDTGSTSTLNTVTITRYHVEYRRTDGRNTPGVDVPFGFDGGTAVSIDANGSGDVAFQIVRHQGKLEPPLKNLASLGGQVIISTIAEVTFYGHDQNGNEVSVVGRMDVVFGDFPDDAS